MRTWEISRIKGTPAAARTASITSTSITRALPCYRASRSPARIALAILPREKPVLMAA
jgi:hypothetical protein